jgi:hypothetical protein
MHTQPSAAVDPPPIAVLMLETAFERFPGDVGNPASWAMPVIWRTVTGATAGAITTLADNRFLLAFEQAGRDVIAHGAILVTTSCGFLALYQPQLAMRLPALVATSALLEVPRLRAAGATPGIITFDEAHLTAAHVTACGGDAATPIVGLARDGVFRRAILGDGGSDSFLAREHDAIVAAKRLVAAHPRVDAIVLECTNLGPHAAAITAASGRPVYDIVQMVHRLHRGLVGSTSIGM